MLTWEMDFALEFLSSGTLSLGLQIAQSRPYLGTLGPKVGIIYIHGGSGFGYQWYIKASMDQGFKWTAKCKDPKQKDLHKGHPGHPDQNAKWQSPRFFLEAFLEQVGARNTAEAERSHKVRQNMGCQ